MVTVNVTNRVAADRAAINLLERITGSNSSLAFKAPCRVATTANITLSGFQTIDGVTLTADDNNRRVLVKDQDDATENGVYIANSTLWLRAADFDGNGDFVKGTRLFVNEGSTQEGGWVVTSDDPVVIGTSDIAFTSEAIVSGFQPLDSDLTAIAALTTTAFGRSVLTTANAAALATLAGVGTADTPQFDGIQVGHASDTTIRRNSAGRITVEAQFVLMDQDLGVTVQAFDSDLAAIAALSTTAYGRSLLTLADEDALEALLDTLPNLSAVGGRVTFGHVTGGTGQFYSTSGGSNRWFWGAGDSGNDDTQFRLFRTGVGDIFTVSSAGAGAFAGDVSVPDEAYNATTWNASLEVPTKNAVRDQIELIVGTTLPATYQPLDSDLTAIAALTPTNDDVIQRKAGAWTNRTMAQLIADLAALGTTFQPLDSDLTSWAGVTRASGFDTFAATPSLANLGSLLTDEASGLITFMTTPSLANFGSLLTGEGTGVITALGVNVGSAGAFVVNGGALGTPSSGTLTNATGLPTILAANEATDTTCFPAFFTAATGELGPKTNANLTYNSNTGALGSTSFVGALTGNADTVTWANEATDTTCFIGFATAASGSLAPKTNANMTFNSNTGIVTLASSVLTTTDINGGTVDGAVIGGSSAAAASFTTATLSSSLRLPNATYVQARNAANNAYLDVWQVTSGDALLVIDPGGGMFIGGSPTPLVDSTYSLGTTANRWLKLWSDSVELTTDLRFPNAAGIFDDSGNEQLLFSKTASAVNSLQIANSATGNNPVLSAIGDDANIGLTFTVKGGPANSITFNVGSADTAVDFVSTYAGTDGPGFRIYQNSASPAGSDYIGRIEFQGNNASGTRFSYVGLYAQIRDTTAGSEDAALEFYTSVAGSAVSQRAAVIRDGGWSFGTASTNDGVGTIFVSTSIRTGTTTVASLPAATAGKRAFVTDANATTFASVVAGGGANGVPVYADGANWRIG